MNKHLSKAGHRHDGSLHAMFKKKDEAKVKRKRMIENKNREEAGLQMTTGG